MKKKDCTLASNYIEKSSLSQEKINELNEDLLTVLDSHWNDFDVNELFYHVIKYMTSYLYGNSANHQAAGKILQDSVNDGIRDYITQNEEK